MFMQGLCCTLAYSGLSLFFDGNTSAGITVFGPVNGQTFAADGSSILSLQGNPAPGSGTTFYTGNGVIVVLTGFSWNNSATPPGDVYQSFSFTPASGAIPSAFGSFSIRVYPSANLATGQPSDSPGNPVTLAGSGFAPSDSVILYAGSSNRLLKSR